MLLLDIAFLLLASCLPLLTTADIKISPRDITPTPNFPSPAPLSHPTCSASLQRHVNEKLHLLHRLSRKTGKFDKTHPRHRLLDALHAFTEHYASTLSDTQRLRDLYNSVSKPQRKLLEKSTGYSKKLNANDHLAHVNRGLESAIVGYALKFYEIEGRELEEWGRKARKEGRKADRVSVGQAVKHFVRDWSEEGKGERQEAFECVLGVLDGLFPISPTSGSRHRDAESARGNGQRPIKVLVPGAGLGRLAYEIESLLGFQVTLNEWSSYMLLAYRYLASLSGPNSVSFHPFIDSWSHHARTADMQRAVTFPDIRPHSTSPFSLAARPPEPNRDGTRVASPPLMIEGDFTTSFAGHKGTYDSVVSLFFIDTARNLISYFSTIQTLLAPDGYWINFGPLLYGTAPFVQLSMEEIVLLVEGMGFEFLEIGELVGEGNAERLCGKRTFGDGVGGIGKVRSKGASYAFNGRALNTNRYWAQGFVVRKVR